MLEDNSFRVLCGVMGGVFWLLLEAGGRDQSDGVTCVLVRRD